METEIEYRHNNAYDSVLLVDIKSNRVRSSWTVDPKTLRAFCDCSQNAQDWDDQRRDESPADYGDLIASRRQYELYAHQEDTWTRIVERLLH